MALTRFHTMDNRDVVVQYERPFFNSKPLVLKRWTDDMDLKKGEFKIIPIWLHVHVDFKY
ncbi:Sentrin-specific protease 5 [Bienertia sinuspersici]